MDGWTNLIKLYFIQVLHLQGIVCKLHFALSAQWSGETQTVTLSLSFLSRCVFVFLLIPSVSLFIPRLCFPVFIFSLFSLSRCSCVGQSGSSLEQVSTSLICPSMSWKWESRASIAMWGTLLSCKVSTGAKNKTKIVCRWKTYRGIWF